MSVRAARWAVADCGDHHSAASRPPSAVGAAGPQTRAAGDFPVASDVRVGGDESQTRLVVDFTHKVDIRAFTLANPYRVVIDMPQVAFQLPGQDRRERPRPDQGVPLRAGHAGRLAHGASTWRSRPGSRRPSCSKPDNGQPARLVLDLAAVDRDTFMRAIALDNRAPDSGYKPPAAVRRRRTSKADPRPLVVLDPGHGGIDNGTRAASGELEKIDRAGILADAARPASKRPANTAW